MAEEQNPVMHGELVRIVRRLDDRIRAWTAALTI
ncbi:MAG: hypothetical protein ETSY2_40540 [Candidatus Entotheonella gemina]|uniref:Uncharacterized protein n=1 Tax=Candidatus Entotheonella gemina TaxID=1429439 RepID=W4LP18_9BACT|nr:MAG: hypothetical protein ETSY2_40540 [Candidatus Entotheonella gemina]